MPVENGGLPMACIRPVRSCKWDLLLSLCLTASLMSAASTKALAARSNAKSRDRGSFLQVSCESTDPLPRIKQSDSSFADAKALPPQYRTTSTSPPAEIHSTTTPPPHPVPRRLRTKPSLPTRTPTLTSRPISGDRPVYSLPLLPLPPTRVRQTSTPSLQEHPPSSPSSRSRLPSRPWIP
jgi:hypothetical protein